MTATEKAHRARGESLTCAAPVTNFLPPWASFPHLKNGDKNSTCLIGCYEDENINRLIFVKLGTMPGILYPMWVSLFNKI